ncbi:hypothetical protein ACSZOP_07180 [Colibacter massiliensis]|uniref:hypothetical protein n=1 Tax=Colibacter massiliensis TaxID=1852379 RepID=UPI003F93E2B9
MNTRVTRLNEVQYADSEYRLQQLVAEGFVADEQPTEETEPVEEQPKKTKAKKAEAVEQPAEETEQAGE